jgi:NADH-quinone oxidoreductase subunit N
VDVANFAGLLPLMVVAATAVAVLLLVAVRRRHQAAAIMTVIGLGGAVMTIPLEARVVPRQITPLLIVDGYGLFYTALLIAASMIVVILAYGHLQGREGNLEKFYVLLLLATLGAVVLALSNLFASLFLGLELLSVGLYTLIAYLRTSARPLEAAVKYLIGTDRVD